jgi:hypothetical protein
VNLKSAALVTAFLLTGGCGALNGETRPPGPADDGSPAASDSSSGASSAATLQAAATRPLGRTRAEVHAEAVEAVKHYKSTQQEEREYFLPWTH